MSSCACVWRVHVGRHVADFSEDNQEVHIQEQRDQVQSRSRHRSQPDCHQNLVRFLVCREHRPPAPDGTGFHVFVASSYQHRENIEWYEASIHDECEEVVTGRAPRWSRFCAADEVVDAIETDYKVGAGLCM
jgi:hypothetical protein